MRRPLDRLLVKLGYIRVKEPLPDGAKLLTFTDKNLLQAKILTTLKENLTTPSPAAIEQITDLANKVASDLQIAPDISLADVVKRYHPDILGHRSLTYVLACGIASYWELSVKNLAEKLRIEVFAERDFEGRKSPGFRDLEEIISDIKRAAPRLEARLTRRKNLRDALIHGNFHQLKTAASEEQRKDIRKTMEGGVWRLKLSGPGDVTKLSEIKELKEIKRAGIFGWFLEAASSELLERTIVELKDATEDLQTLIMFHAMCFNERQGLFEQVFIKGERLTDDQRALFSGQESNGDLLRAFGRVDKLMKK